MADAQEDFFASVAKDTGQPPRDHYGRPLLIPAMGGQRKAYTRASSFADKVMNQMHIHRWEQRYLARGMSEAEDLRLLAAGEIYTTGFDLDDTDKDAVADNRASGQRLDEIVERALDRMGIHQKADFGTAVHSFATNLEGHPNPVPEELEPFVKGYREELAKRRIEVLSSERFTANDAVMSAGTYDGVVHDPNFGVVVTDVKTGKNKVGFAVQTSIYANGVHYDTESDKRSPIHPELNKEIGLLFYVHGDGTKTKVVNLVLAWEVTQHIRAIFDDFKVSSLMSDYDKATTALTLLDRIGQTTGIAELEGLWRETRIEWGDAEIAAANLQREFF